MFLLFRKGLELWARVTLQVRRARQKFVTQLSRDCLSPAFRGSHYFNWTISPLSTTSPTVLCVLAADRLCESQIVHCVPTSAAIRRYIQHTLRSNIRHSFVPTPPPATILNRYHLLVSSSRFIFMFLVLV